MTVVTLITSLVAVLLVGRPSPRGAAAAGDAVASIQDPYPLEKPW